MIAESLEPTVRVSSASSLLPWLESWQYCCIGCG